MVEVVHSGDKGYIEAVNNSSCSVRLSSGEVVEISKGDLVPIRPEVGQTVVVLYGAHAGGLASLTAIDKTGECLLRLGTIMTFTTMNSLAKAQP